LAKLRYFIDKKGSPSDVVLIYWLGRDLLQENGEWYLPTSESRPRTKISDTGIALRQLLAIDGSVAGARVLLLDVSSTATPPGGSPSPEFSANHVAMLRYEWSKQDVPPGLLEVLETAARGGKDISLQDMLAAADEYRTNYANTIKFTHNLQLSSPMAGLILSRGP
jgi:hypothetical protein